MNAKSVPRRIVPKSGTVVCSYTICKVMVNDDKQLKLKAQIAPHGNEDSDKLNLHTESNMYALVGIRVIANKATVQKWRVLRADAESPFL